MSWTKFGDEYPAEARDLTDAEWRTHGEALMWSNSRLLDFRIPKKDLRRFAESPDSVTAADGLVTKGWWLDKGTEWHIGVVHPEWQLSADEVRRSQAKAAARMKRIRRHKNGDHGLCDPSTCPDAPVLENVRANVQENGHANVLSTFATPTRPDPTRTYLRPDRCKQPAPR